jgi:flagellar biosynthesis/type III secretory pathway M-ring protein FliF/YscJ
VSDPIAWVRTGIEKKDPVVLGVLGAAALLLIFGVLGLVFRKKLVAKVPVLRRQAAAKTSRSNKAVAGAPAGSAAALPAAEDAGPDFPALPEPPPAGAGSDVLEKQLQAHLAARHREKKEQEVAILTELTANVKLPSNATKKAEVLARHLSEEVKRNPEAIAHIARTWVNERD